MLPLEEGVGSQCEGGLCSKWGVPRGPGPSVGARPFLDADVPGPLPGAQARWAVSSELNAKYVMAGNARSD